MRNNEGRSPSDYYKLNGECESDDRKQMTEKDNMLLALFRDQDSHPPHQPGGARHGQHSQHGQTWHDMSTNNSGNPSGYNNGILQQSNHFSSNPYLGGPNITPSYSNITGGLLEEMKTSHHNDSSSSSESESSHSSSNPGKYDSQHSRSCGIRMNKDEKLARENGIKLNIKQDIVDPPMDEFNDMLSKEDLSEEQLNICRDIRRRGKNKVAAQNCRKRKLEQIDELQKKVDEALDRRQKLAHEHNRLMDVYCNKVNNYSSLRDAILSHHNKDPHHYTVLVQGEDVRIIEKNSVPPDQLFPKSPDSLRYRPAPPGPPPQPACPDITYNGNMMFSQNNHHPSFRAWD